MVAIHTYLELIDWNVSETPLLPIAPEAAAAVIEGGGGMSFSISASWSSSELSMIVSLSILPLSENGSLDWSRDLIGLSSIAKLNLEWDMLRCSEAASYLFIYDTLIRRLLGHLEHNREKRLWSFRTCDKRRRFYLRCHLSGCINLALNFSHALWVYKCKKSLKIWQDMMVLCQ